ncbi:hypothetical protein GCM10027416_19680 [Okibacterium endophyticum]
MTTLETQAAQVTVSARPGAEALTANVVATLPVSFAHASDQPADLIAVTGAPGWPQLASDALTGGAHGIIVIDPTADDPAAIEALAAQAEKQKAVTVLSETFAGNPAIRPLLDARPDAMNGLGAVFIDSVVAGGSAADQLLTHLRVLRALGLPEVVIRTATTAHERGVIWAGEAHGRPADGGVLLNGITALSDATSPQVSVRGAAAERAVELTLPAADTAQPASVVYTDTTGAHQLPTIYEHAHRAAWRYAHQALTNSTPGTTTVLREFAADVTRVRGVLS